MEILISAAPGLWQNHSLDGQSRLFGAADENRQVPVCMRYDKIAVCLAQAWWVPANEAERLTEKSQLHMLRFPLYFICGETAEYAISFEKHGKMAESMV